MRQADSHGSAQTSQQNLSEYLEDRIAAGALEEVLPDWVQGFSGPFLYYPSRRRMSAPLRAFVDFLKREGRG